MPENAVHTYVTAVATSHVIRAGYQVVDGIQTEHNSVVLLTRQNRAQDNGIWLVREGEWIRPIATVLLAAGGQLNGDTNWMMTPNGWKQLSE